jgi:hypothetical protein
VDVGAGWQLRFLVVVAVGRVLERSVAIIRVVHHKNTIDVWHCRELSDQNELSFKKGNSLRVMQVFCEWVRLFSVSGFVVSCLVLNRQR